MEKQIALLVTLEESEIDTLEKLPKEELQEVLSQAAHSVRKVMVKLGLIEETKHIEINESVSFVLGPIDPEQT